MGCHSQLSFVPILRQCPIAGALPHSSCLAPSSFLVRAANVTACAGRPGAAEVSVLRDAGLIGPYFRLTSRAEKLPVTSGRFFMHS